MFVLLIALDGLNAGGAAKIGGVPETSAGITSFGMKTPGATSVN